MTEPSTPAAVTGGPVEDAHGTIRPASKDQVHAAVTARYSSLAQAAKAGETITDCDPGTFATGGFGPAGYPDTSDLPNGAVRASRFGIVLPPVNCACVSVNVYMNGGRNRPFVIGFR